MSLESSVDYIDDLQQADPAAGDVLSQADDHIRYIKKALKQTFPGSGAAGFDKPITSTEDELNNVDGDTSASTITAAGTDKVVYNDNGSMIQVALTTLSTFFKSVTETLTNKTISAAAFIGTQTGFVGDVVGNLIGNVVGNLTGNADTATAWNSSRTITISGDASGSGASSSGSNNIAISLSANSVDTNELVAAQEMTTDNVNGEIAGSAVGAVGTYAMLKLITLSNKLPGDTVPGSSLDYSNVAGGIGSSPSGTWRLMGNCTSATVETSTSLWLRIS